MAPTIEIARREDTERVTTDLIEAFMDDPVLSWAFPDREARRRYGVHFFAMHARHLIPGGLVWRTDGAAAAWAAPGDWRESPRETLRLVTSTLPGVWRSARRVGGGLLRVQSLHPREPHLYLAAVGVRPKKQGRGFGTALLEPGVAKADELGLPAYLESSNERNVPLYERYGFRVTREHHLPKGPPMWLMYRDAGG